ncbi:MAG: adenylate/guanylate cyclase domain-containing protein [Pseudomonadota bacterium]
MERRLAAIFFADLVGYSRRMEQDEQGTYTLVKSVLETIFEPTIASFNGRIIKVMGDCVMAEFPSVLDAVHCALSVQAELSDRNYDVDVEDQVAYRIGINLGDIILDGGDVYGDMVNIASRVESLAGPGEVWVTRPVRDQIRDRIDFPLEDRGCIKVKNISRPVRVFRLIDGEIAMPKRPMPGWITRGRLAFCGAALVGLFLFSDQLQTNRTPLSEAEPTLSEAEPTRIVGELADQKATLVPKSGSYVTRARTNLRRGPGTGFDVVRTVDPGTPFELTGLIEEKDGDWYKVRSGSGNEDLFVYSSLLSAVGEVGVREPEVPELIVLDEAWLSPQLEQTSDVIAAVSADVASQDEADRIWFKVVVDTSNGAWQDCGVYGRDSIHSIEVERAGTWTPVEVQNDPDLALKIRALDQEGGAVMEVWPFSRDWPESRKIPVKLSTLAPGSSGRAFSSRRAEAPLEVCGTFTVYVDVVEAPEEG